MSKCSITIPVYNRAPLTRQCLAKLLACPPRSCAWEIIVIDDGSSDSTPRMLAGFGDQIRAITQPRNSGFATACNTAAAAAEGDYLLFLNNDTIPLLGWLDALLQYARAHPRAGAIGSKLLYPNGTIQHAGVVVMQDRYPRHVYHAFPADHPAVNRSRRFQIVTGACLLLPRQAFQELAGFDTAFRNGYEDVDLCLRLGERGYEVHYCHESVVYHLESVSEGRHDHEDRNAQTYCQRWRSKVKPDDILYYLEDGLLRLNYHGAGPLQLSVSPLLAVVEDESGQRSAEQLLRRRVLQVHELLKENIMLRVAATSEDILPVGNAVAPPGPTAAAA